MTPKEKAQELIIKYRLIEFDRTENTRLMISLKDAKECALMVVNEIIKIEPYKRKFRLFDKPRFYDQTQYWKDVKKEIEIL